MGVTSIRGFDVKSRVTGQTGPVSGQHADSRHRTNQERPQAVAQVGQGREGMEGRDRGKMEDDTAT